MAKPQKQRWAVPQMITTRMNGIELEPYRYHPRIMELRIAMMHKVIVDEYDNETAIKYFQALCNMFRCNWSIINQIVNNVYNIRRMSKEDKKRYRQEIIFMGMCNNETRYRIAQRYLNMAYETTYRKEYNLTPLNFVNQDWVDKLDLNVVICELPAYRFEAERFLKEYDNFLEIQGRVVVAANPNPKKRKGKWITQDDLDIIAQDKQQKVSE